MRMGTQHNLDELKPKHRRMAFYIARGVDVTSVARRFDYNPQSLVRLLNDPLFKQEVERLQRVIEERSVAVLDDALIPLRDSLRMFADTIVDIVKDSETSKGIKLKAIELGFTLVKPTITKDEKSKNRMAELKIHVYGDKVEPEFKVTSGNGV